MRQAGLAPVEFTAYIRETGLYLKAWGRLGSDIVGHINAKV